MMNKNKRNKQALKSIPERNTITPFRYMGTKLIHTPEHEFASQLCYQQLRMLNH